MKKEKIYTAKIINKLKPKALSAHLTKLAYSTAKQIGNRGGKLLNPPIVNTKGETVSDKVPTENEMIYSNERHIYKAWYDVAQKLLEDTRHYELNKEQKNQLEDKLYLALEKKYCTYFGCSKQRLVYSDSGALCELSGTALVQAQREGRVIPYTTYQGRRLVYASNGQPCDLTGTELEQAQKEFEKTSQQSPLVLHSFLGLRSVRDFIEEEEEVSSKKSCPSGGNRKCNFYG